MVIPIRVEILNLNEIVSNLNQTAGRVRMTKRTAAGEVAAYWVKDAKKRVHNISGKTQNSTRVLSVTDTEAIAVSEYGAYHEDKRKGTKHGTPHNFPTQAAEATEKVAEKIITAFFDSLLL